MSEVKTEKLSPRVTSLQLGDSGDTFTVPSGATLDIASGATIDATGATVTGFGLFTSYAIICDQKSSGTDGGTFTSGAWRTRDLNTEIADPDGIVSISSNQFTLGAGSYLIKWSAVGARVAKHKSALYDVTGAAYIDYGDVRWGDGYDGEPDPSTGIARVTPSGSNVYEIRHYSQDSYSTYGFGFAGSTDTGNVVEKYTFVEIYKEA